MSARRIKLLYTGGTLGMQPGPQGLEPAPDFDRRLQAALPKGWLAQQGIELIYETLETPLDSSALQPQHWFQWAAWALESQTQASGLVLLQGTDTLAWTASALFWLLPQLRCPLILTAAQKPLGVPESDALSNIQEALLWAADPERRGVYLSFNQQLFDPRWVRKFDSQAPHAFQGWGRAFDARSIKTLQHPLQWLPPLNGAQLKAAARHCQPRILRLPLIPGLDSRVLVTLLETSDALILEGLGAGNTPPLADFFSALPEQTCWVGLISQCWSGGVSADYAASQAALAAGVLPLKHATPESAQTAFTWLWALAHFYPHTANELKEAWQLASRCPLKCPSPSGH